MRLAPVVLSLLGRCCIAEIVFANHLSTRSLVQGFGKAEYCCSGACSDGTRIGMPGECATWQVICADVPGASCPADKVLDSVSSVGVETGDGQCWISGCQWQRNNWTWACYDCPPGYVGVNKGVCGQPPFWQNQGAYPPGTCVACSSPTEKLVGDPSTGYTCTSTALNGACGLSEAQKEWIRTNEDFCPGPKECSGAIGKIESVGQTTVPETNRYKRIGYGHDCNANKDCKTYKQPMSKPDAVQLFERDWPSYAKFVASHLPNVDGLNSNQFAALVDYAFNSGGHDPKYLNQYFLEPMRNKDYASVCKALKTAWTYPDLNKQLDKNHWIPRPGGPPRGKINRRNKEAEFCSRPTNTMSGCLSSN